VYKQYLSVSSLLNEVARLAAADQCLATLPPFVCSTAWRGGSCRMVATDPKSALFRVIVVMPLIVRRGEEEGGGGKGGEGEF